MQYLTFTIAGETCAVGIENVESVLDCANLTAVPGSPDHVVGLLNLRGEAVPVVDVRRKLHLAANADRESAGIIVLTVPDGGKRRLVGALVDSVCEVIQLDDTSIASIDDFAVAFDRSIIEGIGKRDDQFIIIMATLRLFS